ncbi:hypothetical protein SAMN06265222_13110 [Neorhodopirellula lusitana]|uniref:Uncharacterized protein n=1 Tax=Neorhodopirellula lusitana TaxID=445327 RepID=A0ABY1QT54_9BACT|nr:hypothetical protein [Neorhodopirellula lusitana]SMP79360.1 hypothetical protein SAMN06265222_13110 [Neorhodopirellula lusitana]
MPPSEPQRISSMTELLDLLRDDRMTIAWEFTSESETSACLSPTLLCFFVDGEPITRSMLMDVFAKFVSESVGPIVQSPGTMLTGKGMLTLSVYRDQRMLEMEYDLAQSSATLGTCVAGGGLLSTSMADFILEHSVDR